MKKKDIVSLFNCIRQLSQTKGSVKFSYALAKIAKQIETEISIFSKIESDNNMLKKDYLNEVSQVCNDNKCTFENGAWIFPKDDKETTQIVREKLREIDEKYKDNLNEFDLKNNEYFQLLDEDIQIDLYKIPDISIIPDDVNPEQMGVFIDCGIID